MECPVCKELRYSRSWSPLQWRKWNPVVVEHDRNCCFECSPYWNWTGQPPPPGHPPANAPPTPPPGPPPAQHAHPESGRPAQRDAPQDAPLATPRPPSSKYHGKDVRAPLHVVEDKMCTLKECDAHDVAQKALARAFQTIFSPSFSVNGKSCSTTRKLRIGSRWWK